jgi:hypothetical protein
MTVTCPDGHLSATEDYCDKCGAPIDAAAPSSLSGAGIGASPPAVTPPSAPASAVSEPDEEHDTARSPTRECPACGAPWSGDDSFCERCGRNLFAAPPVADWEAHISADRAYFDRYSNDGIAFPDVYAEWRVELGDDRLRIGRSRAGSAEPPPEIDLTGDHADPGISRAHAMLERRPDGSYAVLDLGSTNGTTINDDGTRIEPQTPVELADGDRVHVGAWTTVTIRRR